MSNKEFWDRVKANKKAVKKWPKWKQRITINAYTIETGRFIQHGKVHGL